jgi:hypothetical protein
MIKITKLKCFCDEKHDARFMVRIGDFGCIMIDKDGIVHPDEGSDDVLINKDDVIKAIQEAGIKDVEVFGYCPEYQDESGIEVIFEDGTSYNEYNTEKAAFKKAFDGVLFNIKTRT